MSADAKAPLYREEAPRAALADFVHCVWTFHAPPDETPQRIAPDGRPELIIHLAEPYAERSSGGEIVQPRYLFAGQLTAPLTLVAKGPVAVIGVRFHAHAARAFLGANAQTATNRRIDLAVLHGPAGKAHRSATRGGTAQVQDYVERRLAGARIDEEVRRTVDDMFAGGDANRPAHIPERQWQRRFRAEVGVSPRMLRSVLRFRRVFDAIEHPEVAGWVEAALKAGYFDQPQMARDFRRFLGCTAREWAADRAALARALTQASVGYKNERPA